MSGLINPAGALVGLLLAGGLLLVWQGLPMRRRATISDRLDPYLRDAPRPSRLLETRPVGSAAALGLMASPVVAALGRRVEAVLGGASSVRRRLQRAGKAPDVERFRAEQVLWGIAGTVLGLLFALLLLAAGRGSAVLVLPQMAIAGATAVVLRDTMLSRAANRREQRMLAEFPTVAELLALAVAAGEGASGALERVTRLSRGELSGELAQCLADARAGANLTTALQGLADRTGLPSLARFVDGIVIAVERGTPLADVLRAQAQDVREEGRRAVMEEGGKKEIQMMVPVVFLVLPITVLFLVFPGFRMFSFQL